MTTVEKIHHEFKVASEGVYPLTEAQYNEAGLFIQATIAKLQQEFPLNKIISKNKVSEICLKYGLSVMSMESFAGSVPAKNVKEISAFREQLQKESVTYGYITDYETKHFTTREEALKSMPKLRKMFGGKPEEFRRFIKHSFYICAPKNEDINYAASEVFIEAPVEDPIVLYKGNWRNDVYVIVSAWGGEASNENVVNEKMN